LNSTGCSSGKQSDGTACFSMRLMWRKNGMGEVYTYIPTPNGLCSQPGIVCNSDFGISIQQGSFGFISGQWNQITLLVHLNDPPNVANGNVQLFYNDLQAIDQQNLQICSSSSVSANGLYFSTFFGGSDNTWATPKMVHSYYHNIRLWGGSAASNSGSASINGKSPASNLMGQVANTACHTATWGSGSQLLSLAVGGVMAVLWI